MKNFSLNLSQAKCNFNKMFSFQESSFALSANFFNIKSDLIFWKNIFF